MRSRFTHLHLEDLEARLVAGSYFGGPTSSGGLASPLAGLLGDPIPRAPDQAVPGISRFGSAISYRDTDSASRRSTAELVRTDHPSQDECFANHSPLLSTASSRHRDACTAVGRDFDGPLTLTDVSDLDTIGEPTRTTRPAHHAGLASDLAGSNLPIGATGNALAQAGSGTEAAAPRSTPAAPPIVPLGGDTGAISQSLTVANALTLAGGNNDQILRRDTTDGLTIPRGHARIWWTKQNLKQARAYYAEHPFNPSPDDPLANATAYVITGNRTYANYAINILMNFTISDAELQSAASDNYRWSTWVPVVFDWVHDAMTPGQIRTFTERYNYYTDTMIHKSWGGPGDPANDFYWGYLANELNWAIATYYENPMAQTFLDDALITRWQNSFLPWAATHGVGGVTPEGTEYGRADLGYPALVLTVAAMMGGQQYSQTNYYKEAIFNLIYATSPAPTYGKESPNPYYMPFPFGEEEHNGGYPNVADSTYLGDFMQTAAGAYRDLPVGQYAYRWLQMVQPGQTFYTYPFYQGTPTYHPEMQTLDFSNLPEDYYAPGAQDFYTRNQWGPDATSVFLQLGAPSPNVLDSGQFQIWRNGYFLSKETTGYVLQINGGQSEDPIAHNTLLFGGQGIARSWRYSDPQVIRLQTDPVFSYAAVDMSNAFHSTYSSLTNPYAASAIREFIFIKPLETLLVLDRVQSSSDAEPADQVTKTFLLHFPNQPTITGPNTVIGYNGDQALSLTTLLPSNPSYNVVDESDFTGYHDDPAFYQYRLEENTSGTAQSYFLNVLQARDANGRNVVSHLSQNGNSWTITLDHPTLGHAKIILNKGMGSQGGQVGYSPTGTPTQFTPLLDHVQDIQVTDDGPVWGS